MKNHISGQKEWVIGIIAVVTLLATLFGVGAAISAYRKKKTKLFSF